MADNGFSSIRGRLAAWSLDVLDDMMDRKYGPRKRAVFGGFPREVVEIGPGPGANLRYYRRGTRLVAVEPNAAMHSRLRENAAHYGIELDIRGVKGEAVDLPDASTSAVVGTLVLCSVERPRQVISEVMRILSPGGRFVFLEHVAAPGGTALGRIQKLLHRPWRWLFDGCHLNRKTHDLLLGAGFAVVDMDCFMLDGWCFPVTPHIFGQAFKATAETEPGDPRTDTRGRDPV